MAVAFRRGKWVADYRDAFGIRRWVTCDTKREAKDAEADGRRAARTGMAPTVDPDITLGSYAQRWRENAVARDAAPRTLERVDSALRLHIIPRLGTLKVREITRHVVRRFLDAKLGSDSVSFQGEKPHSTPRRRKQLSRGSIRHLLTVVSGMLSLAVDDGLLQANPAARLGRQLNLTVRSEADEDIKALTADQLQAVLAAAREHCTADDYTALLLMAWGGLRIGEAAAIRQSAVDLAGRRVRVERQLMGPLKTKKSRRWVDLCEPLADELRLAIGRRREEAFREGRAVAPFLLLPDLPEKPTARQAETAQVRIRRAMSKAVKIAGVSADHTPHSLRHSFATLHLADGAPVVWVQQQLGHASIKMTVDAYGSWIPAAAPGAADRLASRTAPLGSRMVATAPEEAAAPSGRSPEVSEPTGTNG